MGFLGTEDFSAMMQKSTPQVYCLVWQQPFHITRHYNRFNTSITHSLPSSIGGNAPRLGLPPEAQATAPYTCVGLALSSSCFCARAMTLHMTQGLVREGAYASPEHRPC